jgi:hypothetical protein
MYVDAKQNGITDGSSILPTSTISKRKEIMIQLDAPHTPTPEELEDIFKEQAPSGEAIRNEASGWKPEQQLAELLLTDPVTQHRLEFYSPIETEYVDGAEVSKFDVRNPLTGEVYRHTIYTTQV